MTSRREFLQSGIAASVLPIALGGWRLRATGLDYTLLDAERPGTRLYTVLFDQRFPDSVAFADEAATLGARTTGFSGDITSVWFHDLSLRWRRTPVAIAGLTAQGPLFCLERWAWDYGLRVVYRAEHSTAPDGGVRHAIDGPEVVVTRVHEALAEGGWWSTKLPRAMMSCPAGQVASASSALTTVRRGDRQSDEPLYSWVIAPVSRVSEEGTNASTTRS